MSKQKIIYIKENTLSSIVADTFTFASIVASFWFNYRFIDGNNWLDVLLFLCFFMFAIGKAGNMKKLKEIERAEL